MLNCLACVNEQFSGASCRLLHHCFIKQTIFSCMAGLFQATTATQSSCAFDTSQSNVKHPDLWVKFKQGNIWLSDQVVLAFVSCWLTTSFSRQLQLAGGRFPEAEAPEDSHKHSLTFAKCQSELVNVWLLIDFQSTPMLRSLCKPSETYIYSLVGIQRLADLALIPQTDLLCYGKNVHSEFVLEELQP